MKKIFTLIITMLCAATLFAQAPEKFTYQAVVRNASNSLVANAPVGVRVSILQDGVNGTLVYMETHTSVTNANGLITLQIGAGSVQQGSLSDINWANGSYFLKTETDPAGGTNYSITSTQQMLSVPYALYAKDAGNVPTIPANVSAFANDAGYITAQDIPEIPTVPTNVSSFTNDAGYLTNYTETDPQFTAWDKDYNDLINRPTIPSVPNNVSVFTNDAGYITAQDIPAIPTVPTNVSAFTNDAGYLTNFTETDPTVPAWAKTANKPTYNYSEITNTPTIPTVPTNVSAFNNDAGYLTNFTETDPQFNAWDKNYNDLTNKPTLFSGNYNDLTNKPTLFDGNYNSLTNKPNLATVAISGSYNDLINKPAIPTAVGELTNNVGYITAAQVPAQVNADWNATTGAAQILNKPTLFSGNYNDLTNKPTIPTIPTNVSAFTNDAGYLISYTETDPQFSAWDKDYNDLINKPTIPTNVSAFTNDAGYITAANVQEAANIPTNVSAFNNDAGYITAAQVPAQVNADWNATSGVAKILNKPSLFSGNYNDLANKPTIPTVPSNVSVFNNDAHYITEAQLNALLAAMNNTIDSLRDRIEELESNTPIPSTGLPTLVTAAVSNITSTTATGGGNVTSAGGTTVTARGVCWSTSQNPTVSGSHTTNGSGTGSFTSSITGLSAGTTYYVRAYATNSAGTAYGSEVSFTTTAASSQDGQPCVGAATVTDYDGNVYNTVQIGQQCWMKENLRSTHYSDGTAIAAGSSTSTTVAYYYTPGGSFNYGYLYNWKAVMRNSSSSQANPSGVQGICPTGWHVPSDAEWAELQDYVGSQSQYLCSNNSSYIAKALAATTGWTTYSGTCTVGNNQSSNNSTGFSALPAGNHYGSSFYNSGNYAHFWSSTEYSSSLAYSRYLSYDNANVYSDNYGKYYGYSVRCLRDETGGGGGTAQTQPTVTTGEPSDITSTSVTLHGTVTNPDNVTITAQGFEWKATSGGTYTVVIASGAPMSYNLTGLTANTGYTYRAFVTTADGTIYGEEVSFTTLIDQTTQDAQPCPGNPTVTDIDGNVYNTVQIGNQCWMKENLRTTHYSDGTAIAAGSSTSTTVAYYYTPEGSFNYGYLYNWKAVMRNSSSSQANPSGVQGICPTGWHVPSDAEWAELKDYVSSQSQYLCGNNSSYIAKALASTTDWSTSSSNCAVGNDPSSNNATGFGALPAGYYDGSFFSSGNSAYFWSSTEYSSSFAYGRYLDYYGAYVPSDYNDKSHGYSVRCLRDETNGGGTAQTQPTVTTQEATDITSNSATLNGTVSNPDNITITVQGFEWKATADGAYTVVNVTGTPLSYNLTGLTANTGYTYRAFVTTAEGTIYGEEVTFTTLIDQTTQDAQPCPGNPTVTDIDGNVYNTVQIGNQCWMKENMRATKYADGTTIPAGGSDYSDTNPYYYDYSFSGIALTSRGYLYNWQAAMHSAASSSANPSGVQGICPNGWHLPSDDEWGTLIHYVSQSGYRCSDANNSIAKALASTTGWTGWNSSTSSSCAVGYTPSTNNTTGFSAVPAGFRYGSSFYEKGHEAYFWSSTQSATDYAFYRSLSSNVAFVISNCYRKYYGFSVRCLRDETNGSGTAQTQPTVTTGEPSDTTSTSVTLHGTVTNPDNVTITAQGFEWKTTADGAYTVVNVTGTPLSYNLTGLTANTGYVYRAFVTTAEGTIYGEEVSFTSLVDQVAQDSQPCPGNPTVTDIDGNVYNTVQIGNQCWMKENMRATKYADGTAITQASVSQESSTTRYYYDPGYATDYGYLYNWPAAKGPSSVSANNQGICPTGWHVPSNGEWTELTQYVGSQSNYLCSNNSAYIAKALASTTGWNSSTNTCAVGNTPSSNNATGFSAVPAGSHYGSSFYNSGYDAIFWSSTEYSSSSAYLRYLDYSIAGVSSNVDNGKYNGYSVRCLRDETGGGGGTAQTQPTVTTGEPSDITSTSVTLHGTVTNPDNVTITAQGFEWKATSGGTYTVVIASGAPMSYNLTGLTANTGYTYRAFVTTAEGTIYGEEVIFTTLSSGDGIVIDDKSCPSSPTVTDHEGNVYATVQIGNQCWMRDNLRSTHYSDGTAIAAGSSTSTTVTYYYTPEGSFNYGYLYNWKAVMRNSSSSQDNPSGVQGICPTGWHVPSDAEWAELQDYVSSQSQYLCGNNSSYIAKALAATTGWTTYSGTCVVGNNQSSNNSTGFSALPAGFHDFSSFNGSGNYAGFWSSTEYSSSYAYSRTLSCIYAYVGSYYDSKNFGYSVRCLRD